MSTETKEPQQWKGQSRVLKLCHWCTKRQQPQMKPFQACGGCKEVIYCSRECQVASWPHHKANCKQSSKARALAAEKPEMAKAIANFKKWHCSHLSDIRHAVICALDLGKTPSNVDDNVVFIEVKLKHKHADLPVKERYEPTAGFLFSRDEAEELLDRHSGTEILENAKKANLHMKSKGSVGVVTVLMKAHDVIDLVTVALPSPEAVRVAQMTKDWGHEWLEKLKEACETGL